MKIHCYATGPIDFFAGSMSRSVLIAMMMEAECDEGIDWAKEVDDLQKFENVAAEKFREIGWEGDHRGDSPRFFAVPNPDDANMVLGVIYKQDNNGTCFIASPVPLPHLDGEE